VAAGAGNALWLAVMVLVATSAIGLFYYLRIIVAMSAQPAPGGAAVRLAPSLSLAGGMVLAVLMLLLVWLGVYPSPLIQVIRSMAGLV
jgi:NADH-quinone oxidoreductase subunit N